jgi:hypothetical protein
MNRLKSEEGDVQTTLDREFRQFNLGKGRIAQIAPKKSYSQISRAGPKSSICDEFGHGESRALKKNPEFGLILNKKTVPSASGRRTAKGGRIRG